MSTVIAIYKPLGATPLETITAWKKKHAIADTIPVGYAGRLDPIAEGVLIVLVGDENKKRKEYELLPKTYDVDILLGIATDTYDTLGIIKQINKVTPLHQGYEGQAIRQNNVTETLKQFVRTFEQAYPPYSAARVQGKPLFYWAREGKLDTILIPTKRITIQSITLREVTAITGREILAEALRRTTLVNGEFRQDAIRASWDKEMQGIYQVSFPLIRVTIECTSGAYMRSIAHVLGEKLGIGAIAYRIVRTAVGPYTLTKAERATQTK